MVLCELLCLDRCELMEQRSLLAALTPPKAQGLGELIDTIEAKRLTIFVQNVKTTIIPMVNVGPVARVSTFQLLQRGLFSFCKCA